MSPETTVNDVAMVIIGWVIAVGVALLYTHSHGVDLYAMPPIQVLKTVGVSVITFIALVPILALFSAAMDERDFEVAEEAAYELAMRRKRYEFELQREYAVVLSETRRKERGQT